MDDSPLDDKVVDEAPSCMFLILNVDCELKLMDDDSTSRDLIRVIQRKIAEHPIPRGEHQTPDKLLNNTQVTKDGVPRAAVSSANR